MRVAVYGTLKRWYGNHSVMIQAWGELIATDDIEFESIKDVWYPCIKFKEWTNKFIQVEIYEVQDREPLDWLEWYTEWDPNNLYNLKEVTTAKWDKVFIYEYNWDIEDQSDDFYVDNFWWARYYFWK